MITSRMSFTATPFARVVVIGHAIVGAHVTAE
jgi:hypothetical protein